MILTCPECATRYFVPDDKVGADGRTVKCASCGARWTAKAEPDLELVSDDAQGAFARDILPAASAEAETLSDLPGEALPKAFRQKADDQKKVREAAAVGVVWAGMTAGLAVLIALSLVFREGVVNIWPKSAAAYAAVGLAVNPAGLTIEQVRAEPALQDGHAALAVSGIIRNIEDHAIAAPALKVSLLTKSGRRVAGKVAAAEDPKIPPGETRHFVIVILDPPKNSDVLEVAFVDDPAVEKAVRAAVHLPPVGGEPAHGAPGSHGTQGPELRGSAEHTPPAPTHAEPAQALPAETHEPSHD